MFLLKLALFGALIPAVVAGAALLAAWRPWRKQAPVVDGFWGGALGLGLGYLAGHAGLQGLPGFPPAEATQWLVYLALAAPLLGLATALREVPAWLRLGLQVVFSFATPTVLLHQMITHTWGVEAGAVLIVGLGTGIFLLWTVIEALSRRETGPSLPLALTIVAAGSAAVVLFSGSASLGQLGGVLAATLSVAFSVACFKPSLTLARGAVPVVVVLLSALWIIGFFFAEVQLPSALLLVVAPLAAWVAKVRALKDRPSWQVLLARATAVLVPVSVAVALAASTWASDSYY